MKKLMFAAAVAAGLVAIGDGIESANIVGYQGLQTEGNESPSIGGTFIPVDGGDTYLLGSVKAVDMDPDIDALQLLDPDTTGVNGMYSYFSQDVADAMKEEDPETDWDSFVGWWDKGMAGEDGCSRDNLEINVGQGFLGLVMSGADITLQYAGEAPTIPTSISTGGAESPYICNYLPKQLTLSQITAEDMDPDIDALQVLDPNTTGVNGMYSYFSQDVADALKEEDPETDWDSFVGWWDKGMAGEDGSSRNNVVVEPGAGFLGLVMSGADITFNFPSVLAE